MATKISKGIGWQQKFPKAWDDIIQRHTWKSILAFQKK